MSVMLLWDEQNKFICDSHGEIPLTTKPDLGFPFDTIRLVNGGENWLRNDADPVTPHRPLTGEEAMKTITYIQMMRSNYGTPVLAADADGKFIGQVNSSDARIAHTVPFAPPADDIYRWDGQVWQMMWPVDLNGHLSTEDAAYKLVSSAPTQYCTRYDFDKNAWVDERTMDARIDAAASDLATIAVRMAMSSVSTLPSAQRRDFAKKMLDAIYAIAASEAGFPSQVKDLLARGDEAFADLTSVCKEPADLDLVLTNFQRPMV